MMLYTQLMLLKGDEHEEYSEIICYIMIANIALTIAYHLVMLFIPFALSLAYFARRLYIERGLKEQEKKSLANREQITGEFPGVFQGFEMQVLSKEKEAFLRSWAKDLRWMRVCKLSFEDLPEFTYA